MLDYPSLTQTFTSISFMIALILTPILFFTGYGWNALWFLFGIPFVTLILGLLLGATIGRN